MMTDSGDERLSQRDGSRWWLWILAGLSMVVLGGLLLLAFRPTTVAVVPRSHAVTFDGTSHFTAYPEATVPASALPYVVETMDFEDSEIVASTGTVRAEDRASGILTVYNDFQTAPFTLIKNTRFESADGRIFRTPSQVVIPGKRGSTPGQVSITVIADEPGVEYNVPAGRFAIPGLRSSPAQYAQVYAQSALPMSGGFVGERPGISDADRAAALQLLRTRLEAEVHAVATGGEGTIVFPELARISYQEGTPTTEADGSVRVHMTARAEVPIFSASALSALLAADVAGAPVRFVPQEGFRAIPGSATSTLGAGPIQFTFAGSALIIWHVQADELAAALAGKDKEAFQAIVTQFPGVEKADARIRPFWRSFFPEDPEDITVTVESPTA